MVWGGEGTKDLVDMPRRADDFPSRVKAEVAARVGHRCSMPSCRAPTSGPSESQASGEARAGVAAHIAAASPDGPRYDSNQSDAERQSRSNAIWLCDTDARRIDTDAARFSCELLVAWREAAEARASAELGRPQASSALQNRTLIPFSRSICAPERVGAEIEAFLIDVGAREAWGKQYDLARMILHELALNAFEHGGAKMMEISSEPGLVMLREDGGAFSLEDLRRSGEGGHQALMDFDSAAAAGSFFLQAYREDGENTWVLVDEVLSGGVNTPCGFALPEPRDVRPIVIPERLEKLAACTEVHLYPESHWSYSDWFRLTGVIGEHLGDRVLIVHGLTENSHIAKALVQRNSQIRFVG